MICYIVAFFVVVFYVCAIKQFRSDIIVNVRAIFFFYKRQQKPHKHTRQ